MYKRTKAETQILVHECVWQQYSQWSKAGNNLSVHQQWTDNTKHVLSIQQKTIHLKKRKEVLIHATRWISLENIKLSEKSPKQKDYNTYRRFLCLRSAAQSCLTLDPMDYSLPGSSVMRLPRQEYGVGCHFLLQGIFPTQGLNPHLLHWQVDSLPLHHLESPLEGPRIGKFIETEKIRHYQELERGEMWSYWFIITDSVGVIRELWK